MPRAARGWSSGASAWRARSARRSATGTTGAGPIPGFGDPAARVLILGLAPAAHGGEPHRARSSPATARATSCSRRCTAPGFANQPTSEHRDDGLELRDCYITAAVRCAPPANKPLPDERERCAAWLERELALLAPAARGRLPRRVRVGGGAAHAGRCSTAPVPRPRPKFGHGAECEPRCSAASTPASRTRSPGKLTPAMMDAVLGRARELAWRMKRYAEVLRVPHVAPLIAATLIARFPIGINALAMILYLRDATGSFAVAGVVAGALAAGAGRRRAGRRAGSSTAFGAAAGARPARVRPRHRARQRSSAFAELGAPTVVLVACSASRPASRSRRPRPCCARCGRRCCATSASCCSPPTRSTRC